MVFTESTHNISLKIDNNLVERFIHFRYVVCYLEKFCKSNQEIRVRMEQVKAAFVKIKNVLIPAKYYDF